MAKKIVNNVEMDMTAEEEAQKVTDAENYQKELQERQAKEDLKASAKAKLIAGEALTESEADVMIGG